MVSYLLTLFIFLVSNASGTGAVTVRGDIHFADGQKPNELADNSWLIVKVEDTSMMDAPSIMLKKLKHKITNYNADSLLKFELTDVNIEEAGPDISVSAVINNGWKAIDGDNDWLHKGDYFTDTHYSLPRTSNDSSIARDVTIRKNE